MAELKIKTLVRRWQDARLNCNPKREAQFTREIVEQVNQELDEIKQTARNPKFEYRFFELYDALKPMAESWLLARLMRKAGIQPQDTEVGETVLELKKGGE